MVIYFLQLVPAQNGNTEPYLRNVLQNYCRLVLAIKINKNMIIHECTIVNSVLYVKALVVLIVYSCRLKTTTTKIS